MTGGWNGLTFLAAPRGGGELILYGGGGHGKALIDLVRALGHYRWLGIVDDGLAPGTEVLGVPVLGGAALLADMAARIPRTARAARLAVNGVGGIGNVAARLKVFELLAGAGFAFPALVHPSAWVEPSARLADGVQVLAQSYVSSEARVGFGTVINAGVVVSHDCRVGQVVNLSPGAALAGGVILEDFVQVGMNATVNLNVRVGQGARIGNGATVKADVPAGQIVHAGAVWPPYDPSRVRQAEN